MPTYHDTKQGYINLWNRAAVRPQHITGCRTWAGKIVSGRSHYLTVQKATHVPWWWIGLIHMRESSCVFSTYLGDGSPLRGRWPSFEAGAIYALQHESLTGIADWPISFQLWGAEKYNGEGYYTVGGHGINSPYVWSWTTAYGDPPNVGKFDYDGHYNPALKDPQAGVAAVLKALITSNAEVAAYCAAYKEEPVPITVTPPAPTPTPAPAPTPAPTPPPPPPADPYRPVIEMLQALGKWPTPASVELTTAPNMLTMTITGNVAISVNGNPVVPGGNVP